VCDLWFDYLTSYGVPGFEGTCSVHINRRKNDTQRIGHHPALGRSRDPELDVVAQLRRWLELAGLAVHPRGLRCIRGCAAGWSAVIVDRRDRRDRRVPHPLRRDRRDYRAGRDRRDSVSLHHGPWGAWATVAAATAVSGRAFVTHPGGDGGHRGRRDRRDRDNGIPPRLRRGRRDDRDR
jgi:hypothetical protein